MTKLEICNRALGVIGHDRTIAAYGEQTTEGKRCGQFYPAALRNVLGAYNWDFASRETSVELTDGAASWTIPADCVKIVAVRDADGKTVQAVRAGASLRIWGGGENAIVRYISDGDPTGTTVEAAMPHLVVEAVVYELAALLFGPMIGNVQAQDGKALYESYASTAAQRLSAAITAEDAEHAFMGGNRTADVATKTDLVNRAIAKLGGDTVVTDIETDPSPVAARARLFFRSAVLDALKRRDWDFAAVEKRILLAWDDRAGYARIDMPDDCLKICAVIDDAGRPLECRRNRDFFFVRSNGRQATVRYVTSDIDLAEAPEAFVDLVALDLAVKLAPTVLQDPKAVANMTRLLEQGVHELGFEDANDTAKPGETPNPFIAARW